MTREEYLAQLRALLTGRTPPDELERILAYYTEYFDEAGPQGEGRVIRELGTPAELVGRVLGAQRSRTVPAEPGLPARGRPPGAARPGYTVEGAAGHLRRPHRHPADPRGGGDGIGPCRPDPRPGGRSGRGRGGGHRGGVFTACAAFQCCSARACPP